MCCDFVLQLRTNAIVYVGVVRGWWYQTRGGTTLAKHYDPFYTNITGRDVTRPYMSGMAWFLSCAAAKAVVANGSAKILLCLCLLVDLLL